MRLLIISSAIHYEWNGRLYSYGPYAHEIDVWADLFSSIMIAAPLRRQKPPSDCELLSGSNIKVYAQREVGGETFSKKLDALVRAPLICWDLARLIRKADAVHVRCPGNLGLLGSLLAPPLCRYRVAKYAGQWTSYPGEVFTSRLQRFILASRYWGAPVTVYGRTHSRHQHVTSFFTSMMSRDQIDAARTALQSRIYNGVLRIVFVGRLSKAKNVDILLQALAKLRAQWLPFEVQIIGHGPEKQNLEALAQRLGISGVVEFTGGLPYEGVLERLAKAHVLVLVSETEGWPKALAEGMAFGLICIGTDRGLVREMLADGRGFTVPARDVERLASILVEVAGNYRNFQDMGFRAFQWSCRYSLEDLRDAIKDLLAKKWNMPAEHFAGVQASYGKVS